MDRRAIRAAALALGGLVWAASTGAWAQASGEATPSALARVYACAETRDEGERLACYDAAVGRLRQAESGGDFVAVDRARVEEVERDSFGFNLPSLSRLVPRFNLGARSAARPETAASAIAAPATAGPDRDEDGLNRVQAVIERVSDRGNGRHAFILTNGQIWTQVEAQRTGNVQAGDSVTIRRASMGSFRLISDRGGAGHRVRREE
ncbi:MAG: hypothetical protein JNJ73_18325 [Hyphomonadaceae bacterium]|nr:hypothetical protein [Hyphomonadaceae bacterium]